MKREKITLPNGPSTFLYVWDVDKPSAVLQLVHGSKENILKYADMIEYLNKQGIAVVGMDLRGHGQAAIDNNTLGHMGQNKEYILDDVEFVSNIIRERYPEVPYTIYGHSMGSFIVRAHAAKYGAQNYILSGTNEQSRIVSKFGIFVAKITKMFKGKAKVNTLIDNMSYKSFVKKFSKEGNKYAWQSNDQEMWDFLEKDELSTDKFTNESFITMIGLLDKIAKRKTYTNTKAQSILLIVGKEDPVGNEGKGPSKVHQKYLRHGFDSTLIMYEGGRHEVHNDKNRKDVYKDIADFIISKS